MICFDSRFPPRGPKSDSALVRNGQNPDLLTRSFCRSDSLVHFWEASYRSFSHKQALTCMHASKRTRIHTCTVEGEAHPALAPESGVQQQLKALGEAHLGYSGMQVRLVSLKRVPLVLCLRWKILLLGCHSCLSMILPYVAHCCPVLHRWAKTYPFPSWEPGPSLKAAGTH